MRWTATLGRLSDGGLGAPRNAGLLQAIGWMQGGTHLHSTPSNLAYLAAISRLGSGDYTGGQGVRLPMWLIYGQPGSLRAGESAPGNAHYFGFFCVGRSRKCSPEAAAAAAVACDSSGSRVASGDAGGDALLHDLDSVRRTKIRRVRSNATRLPATTSNRPTTANADHR